MTKIIINPFITQEEQKTIKLNIKNNDGYCPCAIFKNKDTKCMCKDFRENIISGECHCGLYYKVDK